MAQALANDLKYWQDFGFSEQQAKGLLQVTQKQVEALKNSQKQKEQTAEHAEKTPITKMYLDFQVERMKNHLIIQAVGIVFASLGLLGWYINRVDNKTRHYVEARFDTQDKRFDKIESDIDKIKDKVNKMELDIKEIKTLLLTMSKRRA